MTLLLHVGGTASVLHAPLLLNVQGHKPFPEISLSSKWYLSLRLFTPMVLRPACMSESLGEIFEYTDVY